MNQLFVCHTQYNLILAVGLSSSADDMILFIDFNLTEKLRSKLEGHFKNCLFLAGNYPKKKLTSMDKLKKIEADNRQINRFIGTYLFLLQGERGRSHWRHQAYA